MFEEILAFFIGVATILLLMNSFKQGIIKSQQNINSPPKDMSNELQSFDRSLAIEKRFEEENEKKPLISTSKEEINSKEVHPENSAVPIPDLSETVRIARQFCKPLKPFKTTELNSVNIPPDLWNKIRKQQCISLHEFKTSCSDKKASYIRIRDLKNLAFPELILTPYSLMQDINYLEETLRLGIYKFERGEELKDNLDNLLLESEEKFKAEGEILIKRCLELTGYIKKEAEIKQFMCEDLQDLLEWIKEIEANKTIEMKTLLKKLFKIEKHLILILDIITKLEKQTQKITTIKEKLLGKWGTLTYENPYTFIS